MDGRVGICQDCGSTFQAGRRGAIASRCLACRGSKRTICLTCGAPTPRSVRAGGTVALTIYCSDDCKPRCSINGCARPARKLGWCGRHYAIWRDHGDPEFPIAYEWAAERRCLVCGITPDTGEWTSPHRRWCSINCQRLWYKHAGQVPHVVRCASCGVTVDLVRPGQKRKRPDTKLCRDCSRDRQYLTTVQELAERDGDACGLCREPVDLDIPFPDPKSPSVDHIRPRAFGGTNDPHNLQLAHKGCNSAKKHRTGGALAAIFPYARNN